MIGGKPVRDAKTWLNKRRPEIVRLFEENQFGRAPERPPLDKKKAFEVTEQSAPALNGKAYFMHDGGHGTIPSDWDVFVKFLETNLR